MYTKRYLAKFLRRLGDERTITSIVEQTSDELTASTRDLTDAPITARCYLSLKRGESSILLGTLPHLKAQKANRYDREDTTDVRHVKSNTAGSVLVHAWVRHNNDPRYVLSAVPEGDLHVQLDVIDPYTQEPAERYVLTFVAPMVTSLDAVRVVDEYSTSFTFLYSTCLLVHITPTGEYDDKLCEDDC